MKIESRLNPNEMSKKDRILMGTYSSTINISFVCPVIISILELFMLVYTITNAEIYTSLGVLWRYRSFYITFLCAAVVFIILNLYIKADIEKRFRIMNISNPLFAAFSFGWSLAVTYSDASLLGVVDPVLFMTFSLTVPLSIFLLPYIYAIIVAAADLLLLYVIMSLTQVSASIINVFVFFVFQFVLGISFYTLRLKLNERIVVEQDNACIDSMTGLLNRRRYSRDMEAAGEAELTDDLTYISIDLNGLKEINDSKGHEAGDLLIKGAGQCISQCFADIGKLYRIGGDEFAVILTADKSDVDSRLAKLDDAMKKWSDENEILLDASRGSSRYEEHRGLKIRDLAQIADNDMYLAKKEYYMKTGKDRRR